MFRIHVIDKSFNCSLNLNRAKMSSITSFKLRRTLTSIFHNDKEGHYPMWDLKVNPLQLRLFVYKVYYQK